MTKLLERPEVRNAPHALEVEEARPQAPPPMRQIPPPRRDVRWIRWMAAIGTIVLVTLAAIVMMDTTEDPVPVTGTGHPLAEVAVRGATDPLADVAVPVSGTSHPLAEVAVPQAPPVIAEPLGDVYLPFSVTGSIDPYGDRFVRAPQPIDTSVYVSSTVTGSSNPFVEQGPVYRPDLAYVQPNLPGLSGDFGALQAEPAQLELVLPFDVVEAELIASVLPPQAFIQPDLPGLTGRFGMLESAANFAMPDLSRAIAFDPVEMAFIESVIPDATRFGAPVATPVADASFDAAELARFARIEPIALTADGSFLSAETARFMRIEPIALAADGSFLSAETARFMRLEPGLPQLTMADLSLAELVDLLPAALPDMPPVAAAIDAQISLTTPFVAGEAALIESVLPTAGLNRFLMLESEANYVVPDLSRVIAFDPVEMDFIQSVTPAAGRFSPMQPTVSVQMDLRGLTRPFGMLVVERPFG